MIGWFGEDVIDWVGDRVSDAGDVFSRVASVVPFSAELGGALKDLINGPLRDFAQSSVGLTVLRAMSTTIYGPLAWTIGPQVASIAFAFPGLARGQDFWEAWCTEVTYRAEKAAEYSGVPPDVADWMSRVKRVVKFLLATPREQWASFPRAELAEMLGVDEWILDKAISLVEGMFPDSSQRDTIDPVTGIRKRVLGRRIASDGVRSSACESYAAYAGIDARVREALRLKCIEERTAGAFVDGRALRTSAIDRLFGGATAAAAPAPEPPRRRTSVAGDVALVGLVGAAGAALVWFYAGGKR